MMHPKLVEALQSGMGVDAAIREAAAPMRQAILALADSPNFVPFIISMTSGSRFEVRHPKQVVLTESSASIRQADPRSPGGWRETSVLALIHVVSLEPLFPDAPTVVSGACHKSK